ncbi:MAG: phosphodiester glycosidase family protein [Limisphaerales bacterium]
MAFAVGPESAHAAAAESEGVQRGFRYIHDQNAEIPWSIHIVRVQRGHPEVKLETTLGGNRRFGMSRVSEQARSLKPEEGQPVAAINGDFYTHKDGARGRPRNLQIRNGEMLTDPDGHACFWIDPGGTPRMTNVHSRLRVVWPDNSETPFGLNELRGDDAAVLFTSAMGPSTRTDGGVELILAPADGSPGGPLRPGLKYETVVRSVRKRGNTTIPADGFVLSLGRGIASSRSDLAPGLKVTLVTETTPDLAGVGVAIGGGPELVVDGKAQEWGWLTLRHPRSAVGWSEEYIYLVEVDGRQGELSVGMSFPELANYMLELGCRNAMNLDGGGSATLWVLGNVINSPSEGRERPAANALVVIENRPARPKSPPPAADADADADAASSPAAKEARPPQPGPAPAESPGSGASFRPSPIADDWPENLFASITLDVAPSDLVRLKTKPREPVQATFRSDAVDAPMSVAIRLKGSTGSFQDLDGKPSFTLDFDGTDPSPRFLGRRRIYLNNSVEDPTYLNEKLGSEIFLARGIPAPRVGHARVRLNGRALGVYVVKEGFTRDFLARHFSRADGLLCDNDRGSDVDQPLHMNLRDPSIPIPEGADTTSAASVLADAALEPDSDRRWERLGSVLELDRFITFTVLEVMIGHRDGYGLARNNFRVYRHPGTGRWTFLPDGMDQLFGLATYPWLPRMSGLMAAALLETPRGREAYAARFVECLDPVFREPMTLDARVERLASALRPDLTWTERFAFDREVRGLRDRIRDRELDLRQQIASDRHGILPAGKQRHTETRSPRRGNKLSEELVEEPVPTESLLLRFASAVSRSPREDLTARARSARPSPDDPRAQFSSAQP